MGMHRLVLVGTLKPECIDGCLEHMKSLQCKYGRSVLCGTKSKAAGMDAHLSKPIDPERLYQTLYDFIFGKGE